ncbi:hypothetical protein AVEN_54531-1 [Araneus ventricosus]|uniref:Uncharacterized protein n=1 Tax=Araneus ventricosus TaxID=182803 RepID=A0A4Y2TTF4_ARAVE|nr:hypothetical protein AVEN_54531-1 [Araneus ventricosus]
MRSCCRSVCFLLLMGSKLPPRAGRVWRPTRWVVHFGPWCINRPVFQPSGWSSQGDQVKGHSLGLALRVVTVPRGDPERIVHKAFSETLGEVPSIRKLRSGDLLVEVSNRKQSQQILKLKALATIPITVGAHATFNSSKGGYNLRRAVS